MKKRNLFFLLICMLATLTPIQVEAIPNQAPKSAMIKNTEGNNQTPQKEEQRTENKEPAITAYAVQGEVNPNEKGTAFYKDIVISIVGDNLNDNHFLTEEGLHWSDKTYVELIKGEELGTLNDEESFGAQNLPSTPMKAFRNDVGDSGRINYVGKTKSNIDLDLIWIVTGSDKEDWAENSGFNERKIVRGLGFTGEQFIPGAVGNSIVVLYNNASNLGLQYKIVKHGTFEEMPVILSFISTDIDVAQGVTTDLANIVEIIPKESNLVKEDDIIYDTTEGVVGLNGSVDLPRGGYLGAGFLSQFQYQFYSPAPKRVNNSYYYPLGVRYDIFGSSLQANLLTKVQQHITIEYVDESGNQLKPKEQYLGYDNENYQFESLKIPNYQLIDIQSKNSDKNYPVIRFVYRARYPITFYFEDETGKQLAPKEQYTVLKGYPLEYYPSEIAGYELPNQFKTKVLNPIEHHFIYKKKKEPAKKEELTVPPQENGKPGNSTKAPPSNKKVELPQRIQPIKPIQPIYIKPQIPIYIPITKEDPVSTVPEPQVENKPIETVQEDPFLQNTNMSAEEKEKFLKYIKEVAEEARKKYNGDVNQVNHAIANAIAYHTYSKDMLQKLTNDFGEKPKNLDKNMMGLFTDIHEKKQYLIDFPHLAAPLATAEKSSWEKEAAKFMVGYNLISESREDVFFQMNSMTGDLLTHIDGKDERTNMDAYILHYHPDFKELSLEERIEKYYHIPNLALKREQYYHEALAVKVGPEAAKDYGKVLGVGSAFSTAGLALILLKEGKKIKDQGVSNYFANKKEELTNWFQGGIKALSENPIQFLKEKVITPYIGLVKDRIAFEKVKVSKKIELVKNTIIKPLVKVVKPVIEKVVEINKRVADKIVNTVIKPIYRGVRNVARYVADNVMKPIYRGVRKVANYVADKVIKPIYPIVRKVATFVHKRVVKPIVKAVKTVYHHVVKPIGNFVKKNIIKPIGDWWKGMFGG